MVLTGATGSSRRCAFGGTCVVRKTFLGRPYRPSREEDWDRAVALAWRLRGNGLTVPWLDVLIASIAMHDGVRLYAIDAHFQEIAKHSSLRLYRPGYGGSYNAVDDG